MLSYLQGLKNLIAMFYENGNFFFLISSFALKSLHIIYLFMHKQWHYGLENRGPLMGGKLD